jgi:quinol monooxygenase YgiN
MALRVVAHLRAQEGKETELRGVLTGLVEPTRGEAANISYELLASVDDPRDFTFVEQWSDAAALQSHFRTPHVQAAMAKIPQLLDGDMDIRTYTTVL